MAKIQVALQLYTVRDDMAKDFAGTLKKVAEIGYPAVELAGTGGLSAKELRALLDGLGLKVVGTHVGLDGLTKDLQATMEYNLTIGNPFLVCPGIPEERRSNADAWRETGAIFNRAAGEARKSGLAVAYHNHDIEFKQFDGKYGLDIFLEATDASLVGVELDVFWAQYGKVNPVQYMSKHPGRFPLLHLKDMGTDGKSMTEVGEGIVDFMGIFAQAERAGVRAYIVEQDTCARPPLESVRISLENLKRWGVL
jgi:sugar phosphate isomerase/epimerase